MQLTITEALSEINLINKKITNAKENVYMHSTRVEHMKDPFEKEGGSQAFVQSQMQSIEDLKKRLIKIRSSILKANLENELEIDGTKMTISEWLTWKKEVAKDSTEFYSKAFRDCKHKLDRQENAPQVFKDELTNEVKCIKVIPNVDYAKCLEMTSKLDEVYQKLDGKLSLKNATIIVEV